MMKLHHDGELKQFADAAAVVSHFTLTGLSRDDAAGIKAASDAGFPLHAAIDPAPLELRGVRTLLLETSARELAAEIRQRHRDI